jgi:hypothetical protein
MAKNIGKTSRQGQVKQRAQYLNQENGRFYVRDKKTGQILYGGKSTRYKGIRVER